MCKNHQPSTYQWSFSLLRTLYSKRIPTFSSLDTSKHCASLREFKWLCSALTLGSNQVGWAEPRSVTTVTNGISLLLTRKSNTPSCATSMFRAAATHAATQHVAPVAARKMRRGMSGSYSRRFKAPKRGGLQRAKCECSTIAGVETHVGPVHDDRPKLLADKLILLPFGRSLFTASYWKSDHRTAFNMNEYSTVLITSYRATISPLEKHGGQMIGGMRRGQPQRQRTLCSMDNRHCAKSDVLAKGRAGFPYQQAP